MAINPLVPAHLPALFVNTTTLNFTKTLVGKPSFLILTLAQRNADTSVTLTINPPEQFQLASDTRPAFAPSLTLTPSESGTHVHVRALRSGPGGPACGSGDHSNALRHVCGFATGAQYPACGSASYSFCPSGHWFSNPISTC